MYRKNVAGQYLGFAMIATATGAADAAATVTVRLAIDAAVQAVGGGTVTNLGNGQYRYNLSLADTNGNNITFLFSAPNDFVVEKTIVTTAADPTDAVHFGLSALPNTPVTSAGSLITVGTGPGQLSVTGGAANADAKAINGIADHAGGDHQTRDRADGRPTRSRPSPTSARHRWRNPRASRRPRPHRCRS